MNFEAENMIDRFIWRRVLPGLLIVVLAVIALIYYLRLTGSKLNNSPISRPKAQNLTL